MCLASPLAKAMARAWRRSYFFNRGLANGLVLVHPPVIALAYASLLAIYGAQLRLGPPGRGQRVQALAILGAQASALALVLGAWWAQQELNWGGWWS